MAREHIPMMPEARDALIAIVFLWVIFGGVVFFRFLGRIQGVGLGADDFLALASFVRFLFLPQVGDGCKGERR